MNYVWKYAKVAEYVEITSLAHQDIMSEITKVCTFLQQRIISQNFKI